MGTFYLHLNRNAMRQGDPRVWSVRTSKGCFHAKRVLCRVYTDTVFKPDRKQNPKAFLKGKGDFTWAGVVGEILIIS